MQIAEVLKRVDALCPNAYTKEEKLAWCYEVSCGIRDNIKRLYRSVEQDITEDGGGFVLPPGVDFSDVSAVYVNGHFVTKVDDRSFAGSGLKKGDSVRVVYKSMPEAYMLSEDGSVPEELVTEAPAPYDTLYLDFVMSQIAFYQHDMEEYAKFSSMYNQKLAEYAAKYTQTAPSEPGKGYMHIWR